MTEAVPKVDHLAAGHGRVDVARDLTFSVTAGEMVALLGPNGAGKTTALLTIAGLLRPIAGRVEVLDSPRSSGTRTSR